MDLALDDVTVLDLGQVIAMPFCTMLLADLGARVIKVESRERGRERVSLGVKRMRDGVEERVPAAQYRERNKLAITLELKTPRGVVLFKLSETPGRVRWLAPLPGEHNEEVFVGLLGYSPDDLARWRAEGLM